MPGPGAVVERFGEFARVHGARLRGADPAARPARRGARRAARVARVGAFRDLIARAAPGAGRDLGARCSRRRCRGAARARARRSSTPASCSGAGVGGAGRRGPATVAKALGGRALTRMTGAIADAVIACSQTVAAQYRRARAAPACRCSIRRYPITRAATERRSGPSSGSARTTRCLVAIGNVTENRGQDVLIEALPAIRAGCRRPGW